MGDGRTCSVVGCTAPPVAHGWCHKHHARWLRRGTTDDPQRATSLDRFWAKVIKDGPVPACDPQLGPCWLWVGGKLPTGYGIFKAGGHYSAHRFSYVTLVGPIPDGSQIDHLCRVRHCVNPAHLEPVTPRVNTLRGEGPSALAARRAACVHGHEFTSDNTYVTKKGQRYCRRCMRRRDAERARKPERKAYMADLQRRRREGKTPETSS